MRFAAAYIILIHKRNDLFLLPYVNGRHQLLSNTPESSQTWLGQDLILLILFLGRDLVWVFSLNFADALPRMRINLPSILGSLDLLKAQCQINILILVCPSNDRV